MKIKFQPITIDEPTECYYAMHELNHSTGFEILVRQDGAITYTESVPINSIIIGGDNGFRQITLNFGNFGHIHLNEEQITKFIEGLNKVYCEITFCRYRSECECGYSKEFRLQKRFFELTSYRKKCPKCNKRVRITILHDSAK